MNFTIGDIFTPLKWAEFAVEKYDLLDAWLNGKSVFDPTMGEGNLLFSLVESAIKKGAEIQNLPIKNLFGNEINKTYYKKAIFKFQNHFGIDMSKNFTNSDFLLFDNREFDILFGNPPWCNFVDLPNEYKEFTKKYFREYNLTPNPKNLLLGGSRIDIAALIIQKSIINNLKNKGKAVFFLPLSLFLNGNTHMNFRKFNANEKYYSLDSIYDFDNLAVFENIATRHGLACFIKEKTISNVVPYYRFEENNWKKYNAISPKSGEAFLITEKNKNTIKIPQIKIPQYSKPRQGINPCGAVGVFVFNEYKQIDGNFCFVNNKFKLPDEYVYPLITSANFKKNEKNPSKWVLLPYDKNTGKPLSKHEIEKEPFLAEYLEKNKEKLINRKGTIIQTQIKRGIWWAMLGVGKYNYAPYKIVWEAYGKNKFKPQIFTDKWQANQSLQAFIPCFDKQTAEKIFTDFSNPKIEEYLLMSKMEGTMNWAQPGKISSLLTLYHKKEEKYGSI